MNLRTPIANFTRTPTSVSASNFVVLVILVYPTGLFAFVHAVSDSTLAAVPVAFLPGLVTGLPAALFAAGGFGLG